MKKKLKILSFIFAILMIIMSFAACGNNVGSSSEEEPQSSGEEIKEGGQLKAAMCKVDITPQGGVYLEGYGGRDETCFADKPDDFTTDLIARILMLEVGGKKSIYINLEMVLTGFGVNTSALFQLDLAFAALTTTDGIFLSNTHNHQAMPALDYYQERDIKKAVEKLAEELVPVKVGVDSYGTKYGISRSPQYNMDIDSPYDNTMTVVRFDNAETGEPLGLIYSAPIHNTALGVCSMDNWQKLNCELSGYASRYIESQYADVENFTAMHINGFYGNSGPYFEDKNSFFTMTTEELKGYGEGLGKEVLDFYKTVVAEPATDYVIAHNSKDDVLNRGELNADIIKYWGDSTTSPLKIYTSSFGDIAYIGVNYEPFSTIGARLRAESPYEYLIPAGNVGGWSGYIPLKETFHNGRVEVETLPGKTPFDDTVEEQFYNKSLDMLCELKGVSYVRSLSNKTASEEKDGKRVYTFEFAEEITPDKLVLSFGQSTRKNCAENFVLEIFDKDGNKTESIEMSKNSVNYLGFMMENVKAAKAVLTVSSTYRSESPIDIEVALHAMNYTEVVK